MPTARTNGNNAFLSHIPIIDISESDKDIPAKLVDAAATYGFVYIRSVGLDFTREIIDHIFALSRKLFQSPPGEKAACAVAEYGNNGWVRVHSENLDPKHQKRGDFKEAFNFGEFIDGRAQQPMPKALALNEADLSRFADLCHALCIKLLKLFALGLDIDADDGGEDWFSSRHDTSKGPSGSTLRLLFYPAIQASTSDDDAAVDIRAGPHSDYGSLTLLFQRSGQPGLEILTPQSTWAPLAVSPPGAEDDAFPPILVNVADLLSHWTNGLLKSTVHRVVSPEGGGEDRYSIAYFCHPANDTELVPVPSEVVRTRLLPAKEMGGREAAEEGREGLEREQTAITAEEHLNRRLAATFGWGKQSDPKGD
ncbi:Oxoglutarate/iron-dependent dioxygenase [Lasallia pustulata]|uniref:Oxoglutarate/iron-dependent dioxygenase n=1 Tax=Lasallia pustulata TaxID=136370 RepID=A0A1W5D5X8_9LECA|nr:Oxoglutarate/iron-dependent dioxygenase [Lasallia pustulata]